jgi:hypothetical protein
MPFRRAAEKPLRDCVTSCLEVRTPRDCIDGLIRVLIDERGWSEPMPSTPPAV